MSILREARALLTMSWGAYRTWPDRDPDTAPDGRGIWHQPLFLAGRDLARSDVAEVVAAERDRVLYQIMDKAGQCGWEVKAIILEATYQDPAICGMHWIFHAIVEKRPANNPT